MDMVSCTVNLGGDVRSVVHRKARNPVSWPEIDVLKVVHGEHSVKVVAKVGRTQTTAMQEKERLLTIYDPAAVEAVFPGRRPMMEMSVPQDLAVPVDREVMGQTTQATPAKRPRGRPPKNALPAEPQTGPDVDAGDAPDMFGPAETNPDTETNIPTG